MPAAAPATLEAEVVSLLPILRCFARRFVISQSDVDDLTQETVVKMLSHLDSFTPGTSLKSWAFTIMRNTFITEYKRQKRMAAIWDSPELCGISVPSTQQGFVYLAEVGRAVAGLPPTQRQALVLVLSGSSYQAAAESCRCQIGTIKSRVSRARTTLVQMLGENSFHAAGTIQ
ncbi:sigma-70 family RNA polymerase sigma factor [Rhizobium sp. RAF56]|uniref:sigma-70 family RNA polymerase sigma factor n=1 Tax=Rhizobium sp. RAF56 TaxID=3233062 RepID=UPI003F94E87E